MSPGELKEYLERNRKRRLVYDAVLRRFIECNLLSEALEFFPVEEIERGLNTFKFWKSPEWRLAAWRRALGWLKSETGRSFRT